MGGALRSVPASASTLAEPTCLYHGTCRAITGDALLPSQPGGDIGDPEFPVVFASDRFDFAALFAFKTDEVVSLSTGSFPHIIRDVSRTTTSKTGEGRVYILRPSSFRKASGAPYDDHKWWSPAPVSVRAAASVDLSQSSLSALGVLQVNLVGAPSDRKEIARAASSALRGRRRGASASELLDALISAGKAEIELPACDRRVRFAPDVWSATPAGTLMFLDDTLVPRFPLEARVRTTHGVLHAARMALLVRILTVWLVEKGIIAAPPHEQLTELMVAAFFHDAGRRSDRGADHWEAESGRIVAERMHELGFSLKQCETARRRVDHKGQGVATSDIGRAILQTADVLELVRNYVGDVHLSKCELAPFIRAAGPAAVAEFNALAIEYAEWIRRLRTWGMPSGGLRGIDGAVLVQSLGVGFDDVDALQSSLSCSPSAMQASSLTQAGNLRRLFWASN